MKKFVGKKVEFVVIGFPAPFTAKVVSDEKDVVLVKGESDEFPRRLIKRHIVSFMPMEEVGGDDVNLLMLYCENPSIGCPGVKFIKDGVGFSQNDFKTFMGPCESRCGTCRTGSRGELRSVDGECLRETMTGMLFGDYPEKKS